MLASELLSLAGKLFYNGIRYRYLKARSIPGQIESLSLEITHRCICRCMMCNIWKISHQTTELSMHQWADLLTDPCFSNLIELDITGGEPFLNEDLPSFFGAIKFQRQSCLKQLKSIAVTTNAILTHRVLTFTESILNILEGTGIQLVLACAMDAADTLHDNIRNYPGAFQKMQATLAGLLKIRERFPNLILGLKTTILPVNIDQLPAIDRFCRKHGLFSIISPCIITGGRYLNQDRADALVFSKAQKNQIVEFFCSSDLQWSYHAKKIKNYFLTGNIKKQCTCGFNYAFIRSTGEVHICPLLPESIGCVGQESFQKIWHSKRAQEIRHQTGHSDPCRRCTEPGLERYSLYYEGWSYLKLMLQMGPRQFEKFHRHMGLDHYL
jgi:MoaA/NifB/PqqE/SkfB family radical SAM enzyme